MKIPAEKQDVAPKKRIPSKTVEISLPIADEIRAVAEKLEMPYETVRSIVVARIVPDIERSYVGRVSLVLRGVLIERLNPPVEIVEGAD